MTVNVDCVFCRAIERNTPGAAVQTHVVFLCVELYAGEAICRQHREFFCEFGIDGHIILQLFRQLIVGGDVGKHRGRIMSFHRVGFDRHCSDILRISVNASLSVICSVCCDVLFRLHHLNAKTGQLGCSQRHHLAVDHNNAVCSSRRAQQYVIFTAYPCERL